MKIHLKRCPEIEPVADTSRSFDKIMISFRYAGLIFILLFQHALAQERWELEKEESGIKVYTKAGPSSDFKAFKATMTIDESVQAFLSVLYDIEGLTTWIQELKDARLIKRSGDSLQIYSTEVEVPFPYANRDGIYSNTFKWDSRSKTLHVGIKTLDDQLPPKDGLIRITGHGYWKAQVLASGKLEITFEMQVDPGGGIPAWIANAFVTDSPYHTLLGLKMVIKSEKYQNRTFDFID